MSEFKGTKGTDNEQFWYAFQLLYPDWDSEDVIEYSEQKEVKAFQKGYKQALGDSHAPEMLEMLESFISEKRNMIHPALCGQIEQLIQKATKI